MRTCTFCKEEKPLSAFGAHVRCKDGIRPNCLVCHRDDMRSRRRSKDYNRKEQAYRESKRTNPVKPDDVPVALYVWHDHAGVPIYVGISQCLDERTRSHINDQDKLWTDFAVAPTRALRVYKTRKQALEAEKRLIYKYVRSGYKLVNKTHNPVNTGAQFYLDRIEDARQKMQSVQ